MLDRPIAAVTGGASGLGSAIVARLVGDGYHVAILDVKEEPVRRWGADANPRTDNLLFHWTDVSQEESVNDAFDWLASETRRLDVLVNCAGIQIHGTIVGLSTEDWRRVLAVNLDGPLLCMRAAARLMIERSSGSVINISSIAAARGAPGRASYCASKAGLEAITRVAAVEWAAMGIRVNAVAPGYVETPLLRSAVVEGAIDEQEVLARIPAGRAADAAEVAHVVGFLASSRASFITGQVITVDGGFSVDYGVKVRSTPVKAHLSLPDSH